MTTKSPLFRRSRILIAVGLLASGALFAQSPVPRIHSEVTSSETAILPGSRHPLANLQNDTGRVSADTRLNGVTLYFSRSAAQQADLNALLAAQQDPASPQFHKWLTPEAFGARFGVAQSDIDKVQAWLQQQGFSIDSVMRSRTGIRFSGSVSQIERAFQTQMHYYTVKGEKHFAPAGELSVPAALAGVVANVRNLDDFRPKPQHIISRHNFTSGTSGNVFFSPGDIATAYDIKPLYSNSVDGTGQTIAIMGQSYVNIADIEAFQAAAGLTKKDPQLVIYPGSGNDGVTSPGDESESDLDLEWSGSIAPGANVVFVYTGDNTSYGVYDSANYAVDNMIGNIISLSYSSCETELSPANLSTLEGIFSQAAAQGQTVMAASGDQGSTSCYGDTNLTAALQGAVVANYPASSAYVTGVGGTEAPAADIAGGSNFSTYWNSSSSDITNSLLKWIPEVVWNDDAFNVNNGCPTTQNCLSASGGGVSSLVAQPSWQKAYFTATGEANPSSSWRLVPDISFYSSPNSPGYLYCTSDTTAWDTGNGQAGSCNAGFRDSSSNLLTVAGGTSFATPIFAGMVALLNQKGNYTSGSGEVNQRLYSLAAVSANYNPGGAFHDVTSGNNNCLVSWNCTQTTGFSAKAGYDQATGLGSLDVNALVGIWGTSGSSLIATTTTVVPANGSVAPSTNDVVTISVSGSTGGTPTGSVTLQIDGGTTFGGTTLTNQTLDANGTVTYTANFSTAGTHQVIAQYPGDTTHAASTGVGEVVISGGGTGKGTIALGATNASTKQGSTATSTVTITPAGGYAGTVLLNIDFGSADATLGNLCYSFTSMDNNGNGIVQVAAGTAATTALSLDTNANDCGSPTTGMKPGQHPMMRFRKNATHASNQPKANLPAGLAFAGLLLAGFLGRHSRKLRNLSCVIALVAIGFALSACGSSSSGNSDPPKGTYTGTVTGTDSTTSTITSSTNFTFTIN